MKSYAGVVLLCSGALTACAMDYSLAPPANSESVNVTLKVPVELVPEVMQVMYRSSICKRLTRGASGQRIDLEGYHSIKIPLERQHQTSLYHASIPKNGGGKCNWSLSNITLGVAYPEPNQFGTGVKYGAGGGLIVKFDGNPAPRDGASIPVYGDVVVKHEYFPWLSEAFLGGYRKYISLAGEAGIYVTYQASNAREVIFEPVLHAKYLVSSVQPKEKKKGNHTVFTYPDGSVVSNGAVRPDFRKLQAIRIKAEGKQ